MKLELVDFFKFYISTLISIVLVEIKKKRIAFGFTLAYKTSFCKTEINNHSLAIYKN